MKHRYFFSCLLLWALCWVSCSKKDDAQPGTTVNTTIRDDNRCVTREWHPRTEDTLSLGNHNRAVALLQSNNVNYDRLRFLSYSLNKLDTDRYESVIVDVYTNDLAVFNMTSGLSFKNDVFYEVNHINYPTSNLDTVPKLRETQVRSLFSGQIIKNGFDKGLADSCMVAEFGYFNIALPNRDPELVKAWRIRIKSLFFPQAFFTEDGGVLRFDMGFLELK